MSDWEVLTLEDAGVELLDCVHKTPPAADDGLPYVAIPQMRNGEIDLSTARKISGKHFEEWTQKTTPQIDDVVLSRRCNPGETAHVRAGMKFALGQNLVLLRASGTRVTPAFLRWLVRSRYWWNEVEKFRNVGAVFDSLRCADVPKFKLPIPPLNDQDAIASVLGALDDKVDLNRRVNETLEAMARALFKSWFVDFDPVHAKAEGRHPAYMDANTAALFPDAFDDDGVPVGWSRCDLNKDFNLVMGQSPPGETFNEVGEGIPMFQGRRDFGFRYPSNRVYCTAPTRLADAGDTLVSVRAPVGDVNMAMAKCCIGRGVAAVRHKSGSRSFTYYSVHYLGDQLQVHEGEGTVFGSINKKDFQGLTVTAPSPEIVDAFERIVGPLDGLVENNTVENRTLADLRDTLLPKLMSGEIRLRDAVTPMMEVV